MADLLKVDILNQLHVFHMNPEDLEMAGRVRNTDVDFKIKWAEPSQCFVSSSPLLTGSPSVDIIVNVPSQIFEWN